MADNGETLEGTVERIVFYNRENGWTVLRLQTEGNPLLETVVGHFQRITKGEHARFTGSWTVDARHGRQFSAETCLPLAPSTLKGVEKFLGSGLVPGIGPVMSKRIVKQFGMNAIEIVRNDPRRLAEVPGIGRKRAEAIRQALKANKEIEDVMVFLESAGISPAFAHRIHKRYGGDAIRIVSDNPYKLASDVPGIGFLSADRIAARLGIPDDADPRAEAGLQYALEELAKEGHVFAYQDQLLEAASRLLNLEPKPLETAVDRLVLMGKARREGRGEDALVYDPRLYNAERRSAELLARLIATKSDNLSLDAELAVKASLKHSGIELSGEQRKIFSILSSSKVAILTGGPGTGKTTVLRGLTSSLDELKLSVVLAAPTGRAARRMADAANRDARTIHRLLEFTPKTMRFERNGSRPLEADMVIVDEVSMVDIELFAALLEALKPAARLLLVGDPNQLPSVGPGSVLGDLLALSRRASSGLAAVELTEIFRQARSSLIITGAHDVLAGYEPTSGDKGSDADLFLIEREDPEGCLEVIKELAANRIPRRFGFDPVSEVQVLCPMHKGLLGAANLNRELQALLNPADGQGDGEGGRFRIGDKVMQIRNNYDLEVFNGDIGRVTAASKDLGWVEVTFPERVVRYPDSELDQLTLAYACSVHKSQGSEYPAVIIPVHTQHFVMLQRNLLYTAITRGKKLVVLVGTKRALRIAVRNDRQTERNTRLAARVLEELG